MKNTLNILCALILLIAICPDAFADNRRSAVKTDSTSIFMFDEANTNINGPGLLIACTINMAQINNKAPNELVEAACDTTVELNLDLCSGETIVVNGTLYYSQNPSGTEVLMRANGCDSTIIINLTYWNHIFDHTQFSLCTGDSFLFHGVVYSESQPTSMDTFMTVFGCDSIVVVSVDFIDPSFTINGLQLTANLSTAESYQWLLDGSPIAGATNNTWTAQESGDYALQVALYGENCTSETANIVVTNVYEITQSSSVKVYPNPIQDWIFVELNGDLQGKITHYELVNLRGQIVQNGRYANIINLASLNADLVLLRLIDEDKNIYVQKLKRRTE